MSSKTAPVKKTAAPKTAAPKKEEVAAPVAAPAPATSARSKASAAASPAPVVAAPVVAPVVAASPAAAAEEEVNLVAEYSAFITKVKDLRTLAAALEADAKKLEKRLGRELKRAGRRRRTRAPALDEAGNPLPKKPSVFTKPQKVTDDLCVFLGKPKATEMSRSDVTRGVMDYVKKHGLNAKQKINPDAALRKLLSSKETQVTEETSVTILNLQKFLKHHYVKAPVA
jgi:chromatin remodeling complex protein RSC6